MKVVASMLIKPCKVITGWLIIILMLLFSIDPVIAEFNHEGVILNVDLMVRSTKMAIMWKEINLLLFELKIKPMNCFGRMNMIKLLV